MFFIIASICSPLIPLLTGIYKRNYSILWFYVLMCLFFELLTSSLKHLFQLNYQWPANFFVLCEFAFFAFYFRKKLSSSQWKWALLVVGVFILFVVNTTFFTKGWLLYNTRGRAILNLSYMLITLYAYYNTMKERRIVFLEQSGFFWAITGIFIYSSGSFFIFLLKDNMNKEDALTFTLVWQTIHSSLNILKNILLGIALSKKEES